MKKLSFVIVIAFITTLLCSCSEKVTSGYTEVSDPFQTSDAEKNEASDITTSENMSSNTSQSTEIDERYELYSKYQTGAYSVDYSSFGDSTVIEYNGGDIEINLTFTASDNGRTVTDGYMIYLGGVPQMISFNGGEKAELVHVAVPDNESTKVSFKFTPVITKEQESEKELPLQLVTIHSSDYVPKKQYIGFDFANIHHGSTMMGKLVKLNKKPEIRDELSYGEFDYIIATDDSVKKYSLKQAGEVDSNSYLFRIYSDDNKTSRLILKKNTLTCDVIFDGMGLESYRVYFYKNHQRIGVNGKDYAVVNAKAGYVPILKANLENINNHDIIYAVAVPMIEDYLKGRIVKTTSKIAFSPDDSIITGNFN